MERDGEADQKRHQRQSFQVENQEHRSRCGDEVDLDPRLPADKRDEHEQPEQECERDEDRAGDVIDPMERRSGQGNQHQREVEDDRIAVERGILQRVGQREKQARDRNDECTDIDALQPPAGLWRVAARSELDEAVRPREERRREALDGGSSGDH